MTTSKKLSQKLINDNNIEIISTSSPSTTTTITSTSLNYNKRIISRPNEPIKSNVRSPRTKKVTKNIINESILLSNNIPKTPKTPQSTSNKSSSSTSTTTISHSLRTPKSSKILNENISITPINSKKSSTILTTIPKSSSSSLTSSSYLLTDNEIQMVEENSTTIIILDGVLNKSGRSIHYSIHETSGSYYSINLFVQVTKQKWSIYVPITSDLESLLRFWKSSPKYSNKKLLAGWLLSCSNLEFTNDVIINATFDSNKFKSKCRPYVLQFLNNIAIKIQSVGRMYLAKKKVQRKRIKFQKKQQRLRNMKLMKKLSEKSLSKPINSIDNTSQTSLYSYNSHNSHNNIKNKKNKNKKNKNYDENYNDNDENNGPSSDNYNENYNDNDDNISTKSIMTEYSVQPQNSQHFLIGSSLDDNSSIYSNFSSSEILSPSQKSVTFEKSKSNLSYLNNKKDESIISNSGSKQKLNIKISKPMEKRFKETALAYTSSSTLSSSESIRKKISKDSSSRLLKTTSNSKLSNSSSKDIQLQLLNLQNSLQSVKNEQFNQSINSIENSLNNMNETELSSIKRMMTAVLMEIKSIREVNNQNQNRLNNNNNNNDNNNNPNLQNSIQYSNNFEKDSIELNQSINNVLSQISELQKDLNEQNQTTISTSLSTLNQNNNNNNNNNFQEEKEKYLLKIQKLEIDLNKSQSDFNKLRYLTINKEKEHQKDISIIKNESGKIIEEKNYIIQDLLDKIKELEKNLLNKKKENEILKQNIIKNDKDNTKKQQELISQITKTVNKLQQTQDELETYQRNVEEINNNHRNSLIQITVLTSQLQDMEKQIFDLKTINTSTKTEETFRNEQLSNDNKQLRERLREVESKLRNSELSSELQIKELKTEVQRQNLIITRQDQRSNHILELQKKNQELQSIINEKETLIISLQNETKEMKNEIINLQLEKTNQLNKLNELNKLNKSNDENIKVNNYLRSRLKEAEEKVYLLEQHQLEVENLKYQAMKPSPYEFVSITPETKQNDSTQIRKASMIMVNKLISDQKLILQTQSQTQNQNQSETQSNNNNDNNNKLLNSEMKSTSPSKQPIESNSNTSKNEKKDDISRKSMISNSNSTSNSNSFSNKSKTLTIDTSLPISKSQSNVKLKLESNIKLESESNAITPEIISTIISQPISSNSRPNSSKTQHIESKLSKKDLLTLQPQSSPLVTEIEWFDWMDKSIPPSDDELKKIKNIAAIRLQVFFRNLHFKFRINVLLTMIPHTQDTNILQEGLRLSVRYGHEQLALITLNRIFTIIQSVSKLRPEALHTIIIKILSDKIYAFALAQLLMLFYLNFTIYNIISNIILIIVSNTTKEILDLIVSTPTTPTNSSSNRNKNNLIPVLLLKSINKSNFKQIDYILRILQIELLVCNFNEQNKLIFSNSTTCIILNNILNEFIQNENFLLVCLKFLSILCNENPKVYHKMGEKGICQTLINILLQNVTESTNQSNNSLIIIKLITDILIQLTYTHQPNQFLAGTETNFNLLINTMKKYPTNSTLIKCFCHLISNLCHNDTILTQHLPIQQISNFVIFMLKSIDKDEILTNNLKILKIILVLLVSLIRNKSLKDLLLKESIIELIDQIQLKVKNNSILKLIDYTKDLFLDISFEKSKQLRRFSKKILRPTFSDSEFSEISNSEKMNEEEKLNLVQSNDKNMNNESIKNSINQLESNDNDDILDNNDDDDNDNENDDENNNNNNDDDDINLIKKENQEPLTKEQKIELTKEEATNRIKNALEFFIRKKRYQEFIKISKLKATTLLTLIDTTTESTLLMDSIKTCTQVNSPQLARKTLKRCNHLLREAKKNKKIIPLVSDLKTNPKSLIRLLTLYKTNTDIQTIGIQIFTRLTYTNITTDIFVRNGIYHPLVDSLTIHQKDPMVVDVILVLIGRLFLINANKVIFFNKKKCLRKLLSAIQLYENNIELIEKYFHLITLSLDNNANGYQNILCETLHSEFILQLFFKYYSNNKINNKICDIIYLLCLDNNSNNDNNDNNSPNISLFLSENNIKQYFNELNTNLFNETKYKIMIGFLTFKLLTNQSCYIEFIKHNVSFQRIEVILTKLYHNIEENNNVITTQIEIILQSTFIFLQNLYKVDLIKNFYNQNSNIINTLKNFITPLSSSESLLKALNYTLEIIESKK